MTANVGTVDRILRLLVGPALITTPLLVGAAEYGTPAVPYGLIAIGAIFVLTAVVSFCPLYRLIGMRTCRT